MPERAGALVTLTTSIPMRAPATSVDVSIPYTTAGVYWPATAPGDIAFAYVDVGLPSYPSCSDGSTGDMAPVSGDNDGDVFPFGVRTPAGAGTYDRVHFYCRSGAELVSGLRLDVSVSTDVVSASGQVETASADFQMHDVIATIHG